MLINIKSFRNFVNVILAARLVDISFSLMDRMKAELNWTEYMYLHI